MEFDVAAGDAAGALEQYRVDLRNPRTWKGLYGDDLALLVKHVEAELFKPDELFCYVGCGALPEGLSEVYSGGRWQRLGETYRKRCDVVARFGSAWCVVEIKPSAGYVAFGQVLTYGRLCRAMYPQLRRCSMGIVTDREDPDVTALFVDHNVRIWRLPDVPFVPLGMPH